MTSGGICLDHIPSINLNTTARSETSQANATSPTHPTSQTNTTTPTRTASQAVWRDRRGNPLRRTTMRGQYIPEFPTPAEPFVCPYDLEFSDSFPQHLLNTIESITNAIGEFCYFINAYQTLVTPGYTTMSGLAVNFRIIENNVNVLKEGVRGYRHERNSDEHSGFVFEDDNGQFCHIWRMNDYRR